MGFSTGQTIPIGTLANDVRRPPIFLGKCRLGGVWAAKALSPKALKLLERAKGFEPSTPTLAKFGSMKFPI